MKKIILTLLIAAAAAAFCAQGASAFTMSEKIVVANSLIGIARVPAGGMTPDQRLDRVNERLAYIIGYEPLTPDAIQLQTRNGSRVIMVGETMLVTVTPDDAKANNTTVDGLAGRWLAHARSAIPQSRPRGSIPG